jgi:hypothetical protein
VRRIAHLGADDQIGFPVELLNQTFPHDGMVIDDEDPVAAAGLKPDFGWGHEEGGLGDGFSPGIRTV